MKPVLLLLILLIGCTTPNRDEVAKKNVAAYIKENSNDPASYQLVSLNIDTPKTRFAETEAGKQLVERINRLRLAQYPGDMLADPANNEFEGTDTATLSRMLKAAQDSAERFVVDTTNASWMGIHKYRGKNKVGALNLFVDTVYFDRDYNIINYKAAN